MGAGLQGLAPVVVVLPVELRDVLVVVAVVLGLLLLELLVQGRLLQALVEQVLVQALLERGPWFVSVGVPTWALVAAVVGVVVVRR